MQSSPQPDLLHYDVADRVWSLVPGPNTVPVRRSSLPPIPALQRERLAALGDAFDLGWAPLLRGAISAQEVWAATAGCDPPFSSMYVSPSRHLSWEVLPDGTVVLEVAAAEEELQRARRVAAGALSSDAPVVAGVAAALVDRVLVLEQLEAPRSVLRLAVGPGGEMSVILRGPSLACHHLDAADSALRALGCPELRVLDRAS